MKKQYFYIFSSEDEINETPMKLVKTYMNHFCINEENHSEVIAFYPLSKTRNFFKVKFPRYYCFLYHKNITFKSLSD